MDEDKTPEITDTSEVPDIDAPIETFAPVNVPTQTAEYVEKIETQNGEQGTVDIFNWANKTDAVKNDLHVEFFLFNRNYTPYTTKLDNELDSQIKSFFLFDAINEITLGAGTGLTVRDYELVESEKDVLLRTELSKVGRAETLIHLIENERNDIVEFVEQEHEFKRMKGIIARYSNKDGKGVFYVVKQISPGLQGATAWEFSDGGFRSFKPDFGWKVPADNQVLIVENDIFIYNQSKFERLFNYDYKKQLLADAKVSEIEKLYKLSFPGEVTLQSLVLEKKTIVNKLQKLEIGAISQDQAIDYADTMGLELMTDDAGAIIIMDSNDLNMFVNLINEDYITSEITGKRYEIKSKKLLDDPEGEPPRG